MKNLALKSLPTLGLILFSACSSGDNSLDGSFFENVDSNFSEVRVLKVNENLRIEYVNPQSDGSIEKVLLLTVLISAIPADTGVDITVKSPEVTVQRILSEGTDVLNDELEESSRLRFDAYSAELGSTISGQINLLLTNGRTISGTFSAELADATPAG